MTITQTTSGTLRGAVEEGVRVFKGVPYAAPPVGPRRFAPPAPPARWEGVREALEPGPVSHQGDLGLPLMGAGGQVQSEDCLYLNVWTPEGGDRLPVMVWVHGGAFVLGSGSDAIYDGARLARQRNVVVVTINYRLGVLGYLAHPSLRDEATGACGNWGLLDQIAAVQWVQANASAFGGDPEGITIFGESAGAMSVTTMMGTPAARGAFGRVIAQSGAPMVASAEEADDTARRLLAAGDLGARDLHDVPAERLSELQRQVMTRAGIGIGIDGEAMPFRPVVDGAVLPQHPLSAIDAGAAAGIGLLTGTNRDEMKLFGLLDTTELDDAGLAERLRGTGVDAGDRARVLEVYRRARAARGEAVDPKDLWQAIETDRFFRLSAQRLLTAQARHEPGTFAYLFCWGSPMAMLGAAHGIEVPFVFGNLHLPMIDMFSGSGPGAHLLSGRMQEAWTRFATSGDPSGGDIDAWPSFGDGSTTMVIAETWSVTAAPRAEELACWAVPAGASTERA